MMLKARSGVEEKTFRFRRSGWYGEIGMKGQWGFEVFVG